MLLSIWVMPCDFKQCGIFTSIDSDGPVQPPFKFRNSKRCSVRSLRLKEYSSDEQMLWSDCAYAQADLRLCWSHIPYCWKSHELAHLHSYHGKYFGAEIPYDYIFKQCMQWIIKHSMQWFIFFWEKLRAWCFDIAPIIQSKILVLISVFVISNKLFTDRLFYHYFSITPICPTC